MTSPQRPPENPWAGTPAKTSHTPKIIAVVAVVLLAVGGVVGGIAFSTRDGGSDSSANYSRGSDGVLTTTVRITPEPEGSSDEEVSVSSASAAPSTGDPGGLACDGRGVLIVQSIYGNSSSFQQEVDSAIAQNPGAVLVNPGTCPSLRPYHDGSEVYAVVIDYGWDLDGLCAAEVPGTRNARLLNDDTSYTSPC